MAFRKARIAETALATRSWAALGLPDELVRLLKVKKGTTYGEAIALGQAVSAIKGKAESAREIREALEGKATQRVEVTGQGAGAIKLDQEKTIRRITAELKQRGWEENYKRVHQILREDNSLCLPQRKFVVTTDSGHSLRVHLNPARQMVLTDVDQLWRADILPTSGCRKSSCSWR